MSIDVGKLELILVKKLNSTTNPSDILLYSAAIKNLNLGLIKVVGDITDLPDLDSVNNNELWFVEGERTLFVPDKFLKIWKRLSDDYIGILQSWGTNNFAQLGDGTVICRSSPVSVVGGFTDWCKVSVSSNHTAAIRTDGTLWTWGNNNFGQLGDSTLTGRSSPVSVVGGFSDWCQVKVGANHMIAVRTNGTLWSWGRNNYGQLGNGTNIDYNSPISIIYGFTDWCQISVGRDLNAIIKTDGTLWTWGRNNFGQLGDETTICRSSPVSIVGGFSDWCIVSAGPGYFNAAIRTNGTLWTWGRNNNGMLGDGTLSNKSSPVSVVGGFTDWCQVISGSCHTAAIRTNGTLWTWGYNNFGQLGDSSPLNKQSPVSVVGGFTDWCQVSLGSCHTAAIRTNGTLWTWGRGADGQLGSGISCSRSSPVSVIGCFTDWSIISASGGQTIGLLKRNYL